MKDSNKNIDLNLVKRAKKGDYQAFDLLVIKYQTRLISTEFKFVKDMQIAEDIVQDDAELEQEKEPLDNNLEGGVIEDDNPIIMDDDDILDDESEEELINENEIDIPDIENEELIEDDDNDFLVEEDEIEDSDLIITPKSDDE